MAAPTMHPARELAHLELGTALAGDPEAAGIELLPYAANIAPPAGVVVMLRMEGQAPALEAGPGGRAYRLAVLVVTGATTSPGADDVLDGAQERIIAALERTTSLTWSNSERGTFGDQLMPGYEITATIHAQVSSGVTP